MGLDDDQINKLLATGNVMTGYQCICDSCLNGENQSPPNEVQPL